jgi:hypothetical protein
MTILKKGQRPNEFPFRDFCLWDYSAATVPDSDTLSQHSILVDAAHLCGDGKQLTKIFGRLQEIWGPGNTVWGIKSDHETLSFELYFYDYARSMRRLGIIDLSRCLPDLISTPLCNADIRDWFMASIELNHLTAHNNKVDKIDLYFESDGGTISAGVSETWDGRTYRAKNDYRFYRSREDRDVLIKDMSEIPPIPDPFFPGCYNEEIFVLSRKLHGTGVYFSRVNADQTLSFLKDSGFSSPITSQFANDLKKYSPYLFDLGIDYITSDGKSYLRRSAIYGIF